MSENFQSAGVAGHFEPTFSYVVLKACAVCGGVHPLARQPQQRADVCPDCGTPTAPTETVTVDAQDLQVDSGFISFVRRIFKKHK